MKKIFASIALCALLALAACNSTSNQHKDTAEHNLSLLDSVDHTHNSQNSLDWTGTYQGTTPCADCPGIETTIRLYDDETFWYQATYQDRNLTVADTGKFMWHDHGSVVHLKGKETDLKYKVGENILMQLDTEGNQITGTLAENYRLKKQ